jgi:hypothetical protein
MQLMMQGMPTQDENELVEQLRCADALIDGLVEERDLLASERDLLLSKLRELQG